MLEQDSVGATVYARAGEQSGLFVPENGIELPLAEFYEGIAFEDTDAETDHSPRGGQA